MIRLHTLGECIIEVGGERLTPDSDALFAALVYLAYERGRIVPRARLAELIWPRLSVDRARHCLRQLLYRMRLAGIELETDRDGLRIPEAKLAPTFAAGPSIERFVADRAAGTLLIGSFLPNYAPACSEEFSEWLERTRSRMETRVRRVLLDVVNAQRMRADWPEVEAAASELLMLDPLNEEATFAQAEAAAMSGSKSRALRILDRYKEELGDERPDLQLPATVLRRRIAERFPSPRYGESAEQCFVGRGEIMAVLTTALMRARRREGGAFLVHGPPGIGKSRVAQELATIAALQAVRVVPVVCNEADAQRPMSAFVDAVPQLRALPGAIGVSPESLTFLDRLTELLEHKSQRESTPDPQWVASRLRRAIVELLDAVASERPLLLVIEDVHWLDSASWAAIDTLLDWSRSSSFMLLLTSRGPFPSPGIPTRCVERLEALALDSVSDSAATKLVDAVISDQRTVVEPAVREWCVSVGEGNPFFLRELAANCRSGRKIGQVPPTLQSLLDARLARIPTTGRRVLEMIVVLGERSTIERLSSALQLPAVELGAALAELYDALLLSTSSVQPRPRHDLISARVLSSASPTVIAMHHSRAARTLLEAESNDAEVLLAIANHLRLAGDDSGAEHTLTNAACSFQQIGAIRDSILLLEAALQLRPTHALQRLSTLRPLCSALAMDGQWSRVAEYAQEVFELSRALTNPNERAIDELSFLDAQIRTRGRLPDILHRLKVLTNDRELSTNVRATALRQAFVVLCNGAECPADQISAFPISEILGHSDENSGEWMEIETIYHISFGEIERGLYCASRLQEISGRNSLSFDSMRHRGILASALRAAGLTTQARVQFESLYSAAVRDQCGHFAMRAARYMAETLLDANCLEGKAWLERVKQWTAASESVWHSLSTIELDARVAALEGRVDQALQFAVDHKTQVLSAPDSPDWLRISAISLIVEMRLLARVEVPECELELLESIHLQRRATTLHDRTAAALFLALQRAGREMRAKELQDAYTQHFRRSMAPFSTPEQILGT